MSKVRTASFSSRVIPSGPAGVYTIPFFGKKVTAAFSGKNFPNARRQHFLKELSLSRKNLMLLKQVHGSNLIRVSCPKHETENSFADGMLTHVPGLILGVLTADCMPLFFWDPKKSIVGIAHAGWRGALHGIASKMVEAFQKNYSSKPQDILIAMGPSIRKCCYEVGEEFQEIFPEFYERSGSLEENEASHKGCLDLAQIIKSSLWEQGIAKDHIFDTGSCTSCEKEKFFSYRAQNKTEERMVSIISFKK